MTLFLFYSTFSHRQKLHTGPNCMPHRSHLSYFSGYSHIVFSLQLIKVRIKSSAQSYFLPLSCSSALFPVTRLVGVYTQCRGEPIPLAARSTAARLLGLRVRFPPGSRMSLSWGCCVLLGRGLCDRPITRPVESYRV